MSKKWFSMPDLKEKKKREREREEEETRLRAEEEERMKVEEEDVERRRMMEQGWQSPILCSDTINIISSQANHNSVLEYE
jgi:hypothetical protein